VIRSGGIHKLRIYRSQELEKKKRLSRFQAAAFLIRLQRRLDRAQLMHKVASGSASRRSGFMTAPHCSQIP